MILRPKDSLFLYRVGSREPPITRAGDTVNLASRLEEVNNYTARNPPKLGGASTGGQQFLVRGLDLVRVKGRVEPAGIHKDFGITIADC
jgi:class 3 adenylate cyclase